MLCKIGLQHVGEGLFAFHEPDVANEADGRSQRHHRPILDYIWHFSQERDLSELFDQIGQGVDVEPNLEGFGNGRNGVKNRGQEEEHLNDNSQEMNHIPYKDAQ